MATLLFLGRVARPDISVAVQRRRRVVNKWTTTHDAVLISLFAYLDSAGPVAFLSKLGPEDLQDIQLCTWPDGDWCGDAGDTKSTLGFLLEFINHITGKRGPIP